MHFDERTEGGYRIYAGAVEGPCGDGYIAAVVVSRMTGPNGSGPVAYRDDSIACGHRWPSPEAALTHALARAREVIYRERHRLAC